MGDRGRKVRLAGTTSSGEGTFVGHDDGRGTVVIVVDEVGLVEPEEVNVRARRLGRIRRI